MSMKSIRTFTNKILNLMLTRNHFHSAKKTCFSPCCLLLPWLQYHHERTDFRVPSPCTFETIDGRRWLWQAWNKSSKMVVWLMMNETVPRQYVQLPDIDNPDSATFPDTLSVQLLMRSCYLYEAEIYSPHVENRDLWKQCKLGINFSAAHHRRHFGSRKTYYVFQVLIHGGKRARSGRKKVGKTLRVARAFRLSQLFTRNIASCSCREVAKSPSALRCLGLTCSLSRHNAWKWFISKWST